MYATLNQSGQNPQSTGESFAELVSRAHVARNAQIAALSAQAFAAIGSSVKAAFARLNATRKRHAAIAQLAAMDDRMLHDIGLHRGEIVQAVTCASEGLSPRLSGFVPAAQFANENTDRRVA